MYNLNIFILTLIMTSEICSICMNGLGQYAELKCGHKYHHNCIKELFCMYKDDRCPMCREKYTYQPSIKCKPMQRLRRRMWKKYSNEYGLMDRETIANLHYWFKSRKINVYFLKRLVDILCKDMFSAYDYVFYHKDCITLFIYEEPLEEAAIAIKNRDIPDFMDQTDASVEDEMPDNCNYSLWARCVGLGSKYNLNTFHIYNLFEIFEEFDIHEIEARSLRINEEHRNEWIHYRILWFERELNDSDDSEDDDLDDNEMDTSISNDHLESIVDALTNDYGMTRDNARNLLEAVPCHLAYLRPRIDKYKSMYNKCMEELKFSSRIEYLTSDVPKVIFIVNEYNGKPWYLLYRDRILSSPKNHTDSSWCEDDDIFFDIEEDMPEPQRRTELVIPVGRYVCDTTECLENHWSLMGRMMGGQCEQCTNSI